VAAKLAGGRFRELAAGCNDRAAGRAVEAGDRAEQRRLAASGGADDRGHLFGGEVGVHRVERFDTSRRRHVGLGEAAAGNDGVR
jgi:hypothetical protein